MAYSGTRRHNLDSKMTLIKQSCLANRTVLPWLCSVSPAIAGILLALLAFHGWCLGTHAPIRENSGPMLLQIHHAMTSVMVLFSTWLAVPVWLGCLLIRSFRQPTAMLTLQACVFASGWVLLLLSGILVEASPAGRMF